MWIISYIIQIQWANGSIYRQTDAAEVMIVNSTSEAPKLYLIKLNLWIQKLLLLK